MKIKSLFVVLFLFPILLFAQENKVPQNVKNNFAKKFTNVTNVKWDVEGNTFEANFKEGNTNKSATYNKEGKLMETETEIAVSELPSKINNYVMKNYKDYKVTGAAKIVGSNGTIKYEAEVKNNNINKDLMFDKNGNSLNKMKKEKTDKEDEDRD